MDIAPSGIFLFVVLSMAFVITIICLVYRFCRIDSNHKQAHKLRQQREQTFSEIAAYVAEGTISPADAERMIKAMGSADDADKVKFELETNRMRG